MEKRLDKPLSEGVPVVSDTALHIKPTTNLLTRHGGTNISNAIDAYMAVFVGKDKTRGPYLDWWRGEIGHFTLDDVEEDHIFFALEKLSKRSLDSTQARTQTETQYSKPRPSPTHLQQSIAMPQPLVHCLLGASKNASVQKVGFTHAVASRDYTRTTRLLDFFLTPKGLHFYQLAKSLSGASFI